MRRLLFALLCLSSMLCPLPALAGLPYRGYKTVFALAFTPDDKAIVAATGDGWTRVFRVADGKLLSQWKGGGFIEFLKGGQTLLQIGDQIRVMDFKSHKVLRSFKATEVTGEALSPDQKTLALGAYTQEGQMLDLKTGATLGQVKGNTVAYSPDGHLLAGGGTGGHVVVYDVARSKQLTELTATDSGKVVNCVAFSPDGRFLITGSGQAVKFWDVHTWHVVHSLPGEIINKLPVPLTGLQVFPDGKKLAVFELNGTGWLWNLVSGKKESQLESSAAVFSSALAPDGSSVAAGALDGTVRIWSSEGKLLRTLNLGPLMHP
ncbi:MAG: WD40 repeat domain-containing protein [Candidatus Xenobia bacterium]